MAHFEVTVRLLDIVEPNAAAAGRAVESRLRSGGFARWHILKVGLPVLSRPTVRVPEAKRTLQRRGSYASGALLVIASAAWALWFLYVIAR